MRYAIVAVTVLVAAVVAAEEADYILSGGDQPVAAFGRGFLQEVRVRDDGGHDVHVATSLAPIGATSTYGDVLAKGARLLPEDFEIPPDLKADLRPEMSSWEAATLVLAWAADRVAVDTTDRGPQDAESVLARGRGRCSGLANASVALLLAAGFEARTVSGLLIGDDDSIPHRWVECRLPGAGWVGSDPTLGLWVVTPRHIVFPDTVSSVPDVRVVDGGEDGLERLPRYEGRIVRPNRGADLVCRMRLQDPDAVTLAVLSGSGGEVRRARLDPEARFTGLLPGRWVLEVVTGGALVERRELDLKSGDVRIYTVSEAVEQPVRETES